MMQAHRKTTVRRFLAALASSVIVMGAAPAGSQPITETAVDAIPTTASTSDEEATTTDGTDTTLLDGAGNVPSESSKINSVSELPEPPGPSPVLRTALPADLNSAVPADHARIVVQVAGDWLQGGKNALPEVKGRQQHVYSYSPGVGAVLRLYEPLNNDRLSNDNANLQGDQNTQFKPVEADWATCTSDSDGQCVFQVPIPNNAPPYFWVGMEKPSAGYDKIEMLRWGGSGATDSRGHLLQYKFATPHLEGGQTYYSGVQYDAAEIGRKHNYAGSRNNAFMYGAGTGGESTLKAARWRNSIGSFMQIRENPKLPLTCRPGLKIGFLVDTSESMGEDGIASVKRILSATVDGLANSPSQIGFASFATDSPGSGNPANMLNPISLANGVPNQITSYIQDLKPGVPTLDRPADTDWEEGLQQFVGQHYDIVYMITDGNPTRTQTPSGGIVNRGTGNGVDTFFNLVELPVGVANALKAQGTRVVSVGIPAKWTFSPTDLALFPIPSANPNVEMQLSRENLKALSGTKEADPSGANFRVDDYVLNPHPAALLRGILEAVPECRITVERRFYEGNDPSFVPEPSTTRPTLEESKNWPFLFTGQPEGMAAREPEAVLPVEMSGFDNLVAEYDLGGDRYSYVDIVEPKDGVPEGWVPIKVATGKNAAGKCGTKDQEASIIDLSSSATAEPKTNDFRANDIPLEAGCHYIVYYMKKPPQTAFDFTLHKVDATNQDQPLDGAQFQLRGLDDPSAGIKQPTTAADAPTGKFSWSNLPFGRYELTETKAAADNYSLLPQPVYFRVTQVDGATKLFLLASSTDPTGTEVTNATSAANFPVVQFSTASSGAGGVAGAPGTSPSAASLPQVSMKLANIRAGELPASGGPGLLVRLVLGGLVSAAGCALVLRRERTGGR